MNLGRVRVTLRARGDISSEELTLPIHPDLATRLDDPRPGLVDRWRGRITEFWGATSRVVRIATLAAVTFVTSAALSHRLSAGPRIPALPPPAGVRPVPVVTLAPPSPAARPAESAEAARLLMEGLEREASEAYAEVSRVHPEEPVFGVIARALRTRHAEASPEAPGREAGGVVP